MIRTLFFLVLNFSLLSCNRQEKVEVSITNRSSSKIDSVVFPFVKEKMAGSIDPGQIRSIEVYLTSKQLANDGSLPFYIHQNGKRFPGDYASRGMGALSQKHYDYYFFENGINNKDVPLQRPREFTLYVADQSKTPADSISVSESLIRMTKLEKSLEIVVDFEKFSKNPVLKVSRNGSTTDLRLSRDWTNWNTTQEIIYINETGLVPAK